MGREQNASNSLTGLGIVVSESHVSMEPAKRPRASTVASAGPAMRTSLRMSGLLNAEVQSSPVSAFRLC